MHNLEQFQKKLLLFKLSPVQVAIITIIMERGPLRVRDIQKQISPQIKKKGPWIYKELKTLTELKWIVRETQDPLVYGTVEKSQFQQNLDRIIDQTQTHFQNQKSNFYEVLDIYKKFKDHSSKDTLQNLKIPKNAPHFLKDLINIILENSPWNLIKVETNMIIALRKENINFRFHEIEFEEKIGDSILYGGIAYCQMEQEEFQQSLLPRIHSYSADGRRFQYKLEKKKFIDSKTRNLHASNISEAKQHSSGKGFRSFLEIEYQKQKSRGIIDTFPVPKTKDWICSIWAESEAISKKLHSIMKKNL